MSRKLFTEKDIKMLEKNPFVKSVSSKGITYTNEFKEIFIAEKEKGKFSSQIFEECGFDLYVLGMDRVKSASKRWKAAYRREGVCGLRDSRKGNSGRPIERELTLEEKYARLQAKMLLLEAENELLKKIRFAERELKKNK